MDRISQTFSLPILFIGSAALVIFLFLSALPKRRRSTWILLAWLALQGVLAATGFFTHTYTMPPRMLLAIGPPLLFIIMLLVLPRGRQWMQGLDLGFLTLVHVVRVPVEIGLHGLYTEGAIPQLMTFEGRNFDIFSGVTAPLIALLAFRNGGVNKPLLLGWNILCLLLLLNIMFHGILSVPGPFQQFAFDRPNTGLLLFPYQWLPSVIVPLVLLAHVAAIHRLIAIRSDRPGPEPR